MDVYSYTYISMCMYEIIMDVYSYTYVGTCMCEIIMEKIDVSSAPASTYINVRI